MLFHEPRNLTIRRFPQYRSIYPPIASKVPFIPALSVADARNPNLIPLQDLAPLRFDFARQAVVPSGPLAGEPLHV